MRSFKQSTNSKLRPLSYILTNINKFKAFQLRLGVSQGNPLPPLFFDITLEPLAVEIRSHPLIHRIKIGDNEAIVSLYADDLLIYLSDPAKSVPRLLNYISAFSKISGYTINWTKSVFMSLFTQKILVNLIPWFSRLSKTTSHILV